MTKFYVWCIRYAFNPCGVSVYKKFKVSWIISHHTIREPVPWVKLPRIRSSHIPKLWPTLCCLVSLIINRFFLFCVLPADQDNYQTLFGVLDNSFLIAYAIGMFFRFVAADSSPANTFNSRTHSRSSSVSPVGSLESAFLCGTTWVLGCWWADFLHASSGSASTGTSTP